MTPYSSVITPRRVRLDSFTKCEFQNGIYLPASFYGTGTLIIRISDFDNDGYLELASLQRVRIDETNRSRFRLKAGDILINRVNSLSHIGKSVLVPHIDEDIVFESNMMCLRVDSTVVSPQFLAQFLALDQVRAYFRKVAKKAVAQASINQDDIRGLSIPSLPIIEQHKVAGIIGLWDRGIRQLTDLIAAKVRFKQGLMQQLLTGKRRFPDFIEQQWRRAQLGELLREVSRYVDWKDDDEYKLVSIRRRSGGMFFRESKCGRDIKTQVMKTTDAGDFVIARMQAVHGAMTVTPPEFGGFHVSDSYSTFVARDPERLSMSYLDYLSQTRMFYRLALLSAYGVSIEKMTFNLDWFLAESVLIPPTFEEQERIAAVLRTCDQEIRVLQRELQALKKQKKGLMQKLLTGEVRVTP